MIDYRVYIARDFTNLDEELSEIMNFSHAITGIMYCYEI